MNIIERLLVQNPWWEGRKIESLKNMQKRDAFGVVQNQMKAKQIISITGLRRVGKTVVVRQIIESLLDSGVEAKRIIYFSFDELLAKDPGIIEDVLNTYENTVLKAELKDLYVFFDEINHIPNWQVALKRFYDLEKGIKFVVTGSSGIRIKKAAESLAGRIFEFEMKPLNFGEFLRLKDIDISGNLDLHSLTLQRELSSYLMFGGFPELVKESDFEKAKLYVWGIVDKIILSDIPQVGDIGNPEILREVFKIIARTPGSIVEYKNLASSLKVSYQTISKYVHYMEAAYLIRIVSNKRGSAVAMSRKAKKVYLATPSLAIISADSESQLVSLLPQLAENAVCIETQAKYFWKDYYEIDFLADDHAIEVKYSEDPDAVRNIIAAAKKGEKTLLVVTKNHEAAEKKGGVEVKYIPLWKFLLAGIWLWDRFPR